MSSDYNNNPLPPAPMQPMPLPPVEQVVVKKQSSGINIPTFIVSLIVVAALAGAGGWFLGSNSGYSSAQSDFRSNPASFVQSAGGFGGGGGFGTFGGGGAGANGGAGATGTPGARRGGGGFLGGGTTGKITAINGDTLTLATANNTITVNLSSTTKVISISNGAVGDLKVGDNVTVTGQTTGTTVNAVNIILGNFTSLFGRPGGAGGTGGTGGTGTGTGGGG